MNRKAIRDLAAKELGLKTAKYEYANSLEELTAAVNIIGIPCVVKPLMSSSGKGQSVIKTTEDIERAWNYAQSGKRGDYTEVIAEAFVKLGYATISFDAPAHGKSPSSSTLMPEFIESILEIDKQFGPR